MENRTNKRKPLNSILKNRLLKNKNNKPINKKISQNLKMIKKIMCKIVEISKENKIILLTSSKQKRTQSINSRVKILKPEWTRNGRKIYIEIFEYNKKKKSNN